MARKENVSVLKKLMNREMSGRFEAGKKFCNDSDSGWKSQGDRFFNNSIPSSGQFVLSDVMQGIKNHIMVGMSQCGNFLLSYNFTFDVNADMKFRMQWWSFKLGQPSKIVAEMPLFDGTDMELDKVEISFVQWPSVPDRIVVCAKGSSDFGHQMRYFITIAAVPSVSVCGDCDAFVNNTASDKQTHVCLCLGDPKILGRRSCRLLVYCLKIFAVNAPVIVYTFVADLESRCLKHGLRAHFEFLVDPDVDMNVQIAMKRENHVVVNTGNSLHVLSLELKTNCETIAYREGDESVVVNSSFQTQIGKKLLASNLDYKIPKVNSIPVDVKRTKLGNLGAKEKEVYDFADKEDFGNYKRFMWYQKRTKADKMYEFHISDQDGKASSPPPETLREISPIVPPCKVGATTAVRNAKFSPFGKAAAKRPATDGYDGEIKLTNIYSKVMATRFVPRVGGEPKVEPPYFRGRVIGAGNEEMKYLPYKAAEGYKETMVIATENNMDADQVSLKVSEILCNMYDVQHLYNSNYEMEIVDVCPFSGDILVVIVVRVCVAEPKVASYESKVQKTYYVKILLIWNPDGRNITVAAFTPLTKTHEQGGLPNGCLKRYHDNISPSSKGPGSAYLDLDELSSDAIENNLAVREARILRSLSLGLFDAPINEPLRCFQHSVSLPLFHAKSLDTIEDHSHMIAFSKRKKDDSASSENVPESEPNVSDIDDDGDEDDDASLDDDSDNDDDDNDDNLNSNSDSDESWHGSGNYAFSRELLIPY